MKTWKTIPIEKLATAEFANGAKVRFVAGDHSNAPAAEKGELLPPEDVIKIDRVEGGYVLHTFTRHTHQPGQVGPTRAEVFIPDGLTLEVYINDPEITEDFMACLEPVGPEPTPLDRCRQRLVLEIVHRMHDEEVEGRRKTGDFKTNLIDINGDVLGELEGMARLLQILVDGDSVVDLFDEDAGGCVPVDISGLDAISEWKVF